MNKLYNLVQIIFVFFLLSSSFLQAQDNLNVSYKGITGIPDFLNICGDADDIIITVSSSGFSADTRTNIEAAVNLFEGVEYATLNLSNSSPGVTLLDDTNPTRPVFSIPDINPIGNNSIDIAFSITAHCGLLDTLNSNNAALVFDTWDLSYDLAGTSVQETDATFEYRDAFAIAFFTVDVDPVMDFARVNECFDRRVLISNSGLEGFVDELMYTNIQGSGISVNSITVNGQSIPITKTIGMNGDTIINALITDDYFANNTLGSNPSNGNLFFDPNETLEIIENICIMSCTGDRSSLHTASWGCDDAFCQESSIDDFIQLGEGNANAIIEVSTITPSTVVGYCQTGSTSLTISNDGFEIEPGFADMLNVELGIGMGSDFMLFDGGLNAIEVIVAGVSIPTTDALISLDNNPLFSANIDGPGGLEDTDSDGFFDDLPAGESIEITLIYAFDCSSAQETDENCFNDISTFFSARVNYFDVACNMEVTKFRNSYLRPSNTNSEVEDFSTPDAFADGDVFHITHFESRSVRDFEKNCGNNDILIATIELPTGVSPADSEVRLTKNASSTPFNILESVVTGSTWEITFDSSDNEFLNGNYELVLAFQADCNVEVGLSSFPFKFEFYCPECDCRHTWYCADLAGPFIHKDVPPCPADPSLVCAQGLKTTSFEANRSTFGFTDNTYTTPFNEANANKKVAVSCDSVEMLITTEVGASPINGNFGFVINHSNIDGTDSADETFLFDNGMVVITKGGTELTCPITPANLNVSDVAGFKTYRFEFPNCLSDLGITLAPGDLVEFRGKFAVNSEGPYVVQFKKVPNFRAFGFSVEGGVDQSCESFGDIFTLAKTNTLFAYPNSSNFPEGCEETFLDYRIISVYNGFDDQYGEELYPSIKVDSIAFDFDPAILQGFDVFEPQVSIPGHPIHGNDYFTVPGFESFSNGQYIAYFDTLNIVPSLNEVRSYSFSFRIRTIASCQSEVASSNGNNIYNFDPTVYYQNRYYANFVGDPTCVELREEQVDNDIQFTEPPTFSFNPITNPDVILLGDTAIWDIRLCNTSFESDAGVLWFAIENLGQDVEIFGIEDISIPGAPTELDFSTYGSTGYNVFAYADGILRANGVNSFEDICRTIRFKVGPRRCGMLNLNVRSGWNCIPYAEADWSPENYPPCEDLRIPLSIVTTDPFLDANIFEQPTEASDLCEPIDITILLRNEDIGTAFDIKTQLFIPLEGATLVPGSVEFAYPSGAAFQAALSDPTLVGSTARGIEYIYEDFSQLNSYLNQNGLEGFDAVNPTDSNEFKIKYQIITDCDFISNSLSYYNFQGLKGCTDSTNLEIGESLPVEISGTGSANGKLYDIEYGTGSQLVPLQASAIEIVVTNLTSIASSETEDFISFTLPQNVSYIPNSSTAVSPVTWLVGEPSIETMNGLTVLTWNLPAGLGINEQARLRFDLSAPDYDCSITSQETRLLTVGNIRFTCVTDNNECENTAITSTTGDQVVLLPVNSGSLNYTINSITSTCTNSSEELLMINGSIEVGDTPLPNVSFPIMYSFDSNGNGVVDAGDTQIQLFTINGPLAANTSMPFLHEISVPLEQVCSLLFSADATTVLDGECEYYETTLATPQLLNAGADLNTCSNATSFSAKIGAENCANTYVHNWTAVPSEYSSFLSDVTIADPNLDFDPSTITESEILYIVETARPGCNSSRDTIVINLNNGVELQVDVPNNTAVCPSTDITLTASGAETYVWTNTTNGNILSNEASVTIPFTGDMTISLVGSNSNNCQNEQSITLLADVGICPCTTPIIYHVATSESNCGNATGSALVNVQGNPADYSYTWSPDLGTSIGAGNAREKLSFGGYLITVSDPTNAACSAETFAVVQNQDGPQATYTSTPATCSVADGTANLLPSNYFYAWSDGGTGNSRTGLQSGIYFASFSDIADPACGNVIAVLIEEDNPLEAEAMINTIPSCDGSDGAVEIIPTGGSGNYSFLWADGNTQGNRTDLVHGVYSVTITDMDESMCELPFLFVLPADVPLANLTLTEINDVSCFGAADGSAFFDVVYDPSFVGEADTILTNTISEFTNGSLPPGTYCYVIEDENACTAGGDCFTIEEPDALLIMSSTTDDCENGGTIEVSILGGTPPYQYDWADIIGEENASFRQNLAVGSYDLTLTDANACFISTTVEVEPCNCQAVEITSTMMQEATCGNADGVATINISNDPSLYNYTWLPDVGLPQGAGNIRVNLPVGAYNIIVSDPNDASCSDSVDLFITASNGAEATATTTAASCSAADGTATLSPDNFTYTWGDSFEGNSRTDLTFGIYEVTVVDPAEPECPGIVAVIVQENNPLEAEAIINLNPNCGQSNGAVSLVASGGSGAYTYLWEDGFIGSDRTDLPSGLYAVNITSQDDSACNLPFLFVLTDDVPMAEIIINDTFHVSCYGEANGGIDFDINFDPAFAEPAAITFSDGFNTFENGFLPAGTYCMLIQDENTCTAGGACFTIQQPEQLEVNFILTPSCNNEGTIVSEVRGGTAPYIFDWADVDGVDNPMDRTGLLAGTYGVTIIDQNDCIIIEDAVVIPECEMIIDCGLFIENEIALSATSCAEGIEYCLPIPFESLNDFDITVNGNAPSIVGACDTTLQESLILLDTGLQVIVLNNSTLNCTDTLFANVSCNLDCDLFGGMDSTLLEIVSCTGNAEFCLSQVKPENRDSFNIFVDGAEYSGMIGGCMLDSIGRYEYSELAAFNGPFEIVGWTINGNLFTGGTITTVTELIDFMNQSDPTGNWVDDPSNFKIDGGDLANDYGRLELLDLTLQAPIILGETISYMLIPGALFIELALGVHEVVLQDTLTLCADTITVTVECNDVCDYFNGLDSLVTPITDCERFSAFCLDILSPESIDSFTIFVDSTLYEGAFGGCDFDSIGRYEYDQLFELEGPFEVIAWEVNDTVFSGAIIDDMSGIVDFMNNVDPTGNWVDFPSLYKIEGGNTSNEYGVFEVIDAVTGATIRLGEEISFAFIPNSVQIQVELGEHEIILVNNQTMCADTLQITVIDNPDLGCQLITDIINPYDTVKYTINPNILDVSGDSLTISNYCEEDLNGSVEFILDSLCVIYIGNALGPDSACIEICDELGICDTLIFDILVVSELETIYDTLFISETDTFCLDTTIFLGSNFEITDFCTDASDGDVDFFIDPIDYCLEYTGIQVGQDSSCIEICDDLGYCDTLYFIVTVEDFNDDLVAVDDIDTTFIGEPIVLDIKANDTILGGIDTAYIVDLPTYGEAFLNLDCSATYNPNEGICDVTDEFTYVICNINGCDTATVSLYIDCQGEIIIYTAVSPNGDGANDNFFIAGIEFYPNNQLCIFNRWGNQVYQTKGYQNDWSGTWDNNKELPDGTYFYVLELNDEAGRVLRGYFEMFR